MPRRLCKDLNSPVENVIIIIGAIMITALVVVGVISLVNAIDNKINPKKNVSTPTSRSEDNVTSNNDVDVLDNYEVVISEPAGTAHYYVTHVRDGDTIEIEMNGQGQAVRLIGVDTPESVHPEKPVECYGPEASTYTKNRLEGKDVGLELDASQGEYDAYGRILAYVYIDGLNYNYELIKEGYGLEYTFDTAYKYQDEFKLAQIDSINNNRGLWGTCRIPEPADTISF